MQDVIRGWCEPRLGPGTLAVLWCGPAARGFDDFGDDLDVCFVVDDEGFAREWQNGRHRLRDVAGGRVVSARGLCVSSMQHLPWTAEQRYDLAHAQVIWDPQGSVTALLREGAEIAEAARRKECLGFYVALRELWSGLAHQLRRRDPDAVAAAAYQVAETAMRLHFALTSPGQPPRTWLLPEFRASRPPLGWESAVHELLRREPGADLKRAASHLVELARDAIHTAFSISRGRLDAWATLPVE